MWLRSCRSGTTACSSTSICPPISGRYANCGLKRTRMKPPDGRLNASTPSEELRLLVDAVEDYAIFVLSPQGEIRSWNLGATRIMGYQAAEAIGKNFSMFYAPEDLEERKPQHELEVAAVDGRIEDEGWRVRKDGTRFWASTIITALRDATG